MSDVVEEIVPEIVDDVSMGLGRVFGGMTIGLGLGAAGGYFLAKRMLEKKYADIAAEEAAEMREHYQAKVIAIEGSATKPSVEALVRDKGYSPEPTEPPMAVTPPAKVVEAASAEDKVEADASDTADAEEDYERERTQNVFEKSEPQPTPGWDYEAERARRSPHKPYVISRAEKDEEQVYDLVTFTYYEADDVLCNERDDVIGEDVRDSMIGESNLNRFGHGSDDPHIVFIRNDRLEMVIELVHSEQSYAEEVHGFQHSDTPYPRQRRKVRFDDE